MKKLRTYTFMQLLILILIFSSSSVEAKNFTNSGIIGENLKKNTKTLSPSKRDLFSRKFNNHLQHGWFILIPAIHSFLSIEYMDNIEETKKRQQHLEEEK